MGLTCGLDGCQGQVMADGFCDTCGRQPATVGRFASSATAEPRSAPAGAPSGTPAGPSCPSCGASRDPEAQFCEACGFDFVRGKSPSLPVARPSPDEAAAGPEPDTGGAGVNRNAWKAVIESDSAWFARFCETWKSAHGNDCPIDFPGEHRRSIALDGPVVVIGRHAAGIDLAQEPNDPAVSHRHASLILLEDGTYALTDLDSSNGTYVNDRPIARGQTTPIGDGDSFTVGAFTRVTLSHVGA